MAQSVRNSGGRTVRGTYETATVENGGSATLATAGNVIRYSFYAAGLIVFCIIGSAVIAVANWFPTAVEGPPVFRIAMPEVSRLPVTANQIRGGFGEAHIRQYGRLHNREIDLAVALVVPKSGALGGTEIAQDLRTINLLRGMRTRFVGGHHDMETRFGELRATDMLVESDGRWKQCLAFRSRFETPSVYFTGWFCDATGSRPSAGALACMIDRLVLEAPVKSPAADAFLRERIARSAKCYGAPVTQTTDTSSRRGTSSPAKWSQPSAQQRRPNY